jgi:hypothetical protein
MSRGLRYKDPDLDTRLKSASFANRLGVIVGHCLTPVAMLFGG